MYYNIAEANAVQQNVLFCTSCVEGANLGITNNPCIII